MASDSKYYQKAATWHVLLLPLAQLPSVLNLVFHLSTFADGTDVLKKKEETSE